MLEQQLTDLVVAHAAQSDGRVELAILAAARPGPETMTCLVHLEIENLGPDESVTYLQVLDRATSWLSTLESRALVQAAGPQQTTRRVAVLDRASDRERHVELADEMRDEIAAALHRSPAAVHDQLEHARLLHGPLRRTREAMARGEIGQQQARALARQAHRMSGRLVCLGQDPSTDSPADSEERARFASSCRALEDRVLSRARTATPGQVRSLATRAVAAIDAAGATQRRRQAREDIGVWIVPEDDGLALLLARMDATDAARVYAAIQAHVAQSPVAADSVVTVGQQRAAALLHLSCAARRPSSDDPTSPNTTACIDVVVGLPTLLGLSEEPALLGRSGTGEQQPLPAEALRALMADPSIGLTLRRLVTDDVTGALLDRGRNSYRVSESMRAFLVSRDGTCRFPGCRRRASACDIDHATSWEDGGGTDRDNLGALCRRHHQLKTHGDWRVTDSAVDGSCTWIAPSGRRYRTEPEPVSTHPPP